MSDAPEYIWLQWIPNDIPNNDEITWCIDPIHEDDTTYVRKDVAEAQNVALLEALKKIAKGEGAFSTDRLTHANNTIENMMSIAEQAIAQVRGI